MIASFLAEFGENRLKTLSLRTYNLHMPHSHQSLNTFKSCLIKQGLKLFSLQKLFADFFFTANLVQMKKQVKAHLNSLFKVVIQLSVAEFHFVKPGLIKHVLLV